MQNRGFTFIELMITAAIVAIFIPAIYKALSFGLFESRQGEQFTVAWALAKEQMEAVYAIKRKGDAAWWANTAMNTQPTEYYQPGMVAGVWSLGPKRDSTTTPPVADPAPYTKTVRIFELNRCGTHPDIYLCSGAAPVEPEARRVAVTVAWIENGQDQSVALESYITRY